MSTRLERNEAIEALEKQFASAKGIYVTNFSNITVEKVTQFRNDLRKSGAKYIVAKNTLARIAMERNGITGMTQFLKGPTGIAITETDAVAPAKVIRDFQKNNKNLIELTVARVEGTVFSGVDAMKIADLPSREVLLSQLLSCLQAPMSNLVGTLSGVIGKLAWSLEAVKAKKESGN